VVGGVVGGVALMFLDICGSWTFHRVKRDSKKCLGTSQWDEVKNPLDNSGCLFKAVCALLVCWPTPCVFDTQNKLLQPQFLTSKVSKVIGLMVNIWMSKLSLLCV
jgi:hypothetical protein